MDNGAVKFIHFCVRSNKRWQFHPGWDEGSAAREKKTRRTKERKKERKVRRKSLAKTKLLVVAIFVEERKELPFTRSCEPYLASSLTF